MSGPRAARVERLPLLILAVMTLLCFAGPLGVWWVLQGGKSEGWPPDRPVEWISLIGSSGVVLAMMIVLLSMNLRTTKAIQAEARSASEARSRAAS